MGVLIVIGFIAVHASIIAVIGRFQNGSFRDWWRS